MHTFWREVFGRAAQSPRAVLDDLGEAEVGDLHVAVGVVEDVLGLEIPVDDVEMMQVLEGEHDLRGVEARGLLAVASGATQMCEHLAAAHVLEHHVEVGVVLEAPQEAHNERKVDGREDLLLIERVLHLLHLHDVLLLEHLERVALRAIRAHVRDHHSAEAARADRSVELEVGQRDAAAVRLLLLH